ncbi:MAG: circadian phase modifier CpmA [Synechococcus sp. TMED187]|nr:MAG: circadian phase modifier CpmA [Synechococcus sp. TMED187]RZO12578.1 MAG: nickel pincer cofactor biosynthesis protein LarB [Synechococcus sp. MED-G135]
MSDFPASDQQQRDDVRFDWGRPARIGLHEAIWGEHKSAEQIAAILNQLAERDQLALVTRVSEEKASTVRTLLAAQSEAAVLRWYASARCLSFGRLPVRRAELGEVMVLGAGTSDLTVASEAQLALQCHGVACGLMLDVGVAGLHRLLEQLPRLKPCQVLIACAGMEGALPTVLAGLVPQPVIGVPVSVGYGVSAGGRTALEGMLASCAPGLTVVNIDNGYGAAMAALRILQSNGGTGLSR